MRTGDGTSGWSSSQIDTLSNNTYWTDNAAGLGIDTTNGSFTYASNISLSPALAKLGANTLTLSGYNIYPGPTTVSGGVLQLGNNSALPGGDLIFAASAGTVTLDMNGFTRDGLALSGGTNAVVDIVSSAGSCTLTVGNNDASSTFCGVIKNTTGRSAGLTKIGTGVLGLPIATATAAAPRARRGHPLRGHAPASAASARRASSSARRRHGILEITGSTTYDDVRGFMFAANGRISQATRPELRSLAFSRARGN